VSLRAGKRPPETQYTDAQSTFTLVIAAGMRNRSQKTASNLQHGKDQDLIRGSLMDFLLAARKGLWYILFVSIFSPTTAEMCCCPAICCAQTHSGVRKWLG
jgi:hypothetical protein